MLRYAGISALFIILVPAAASAQGPGAVVVTPVDTFMLIVPVRPVDEIKKDIDMIQAYRSRSKARLYDAKDQVLRIGKLIEVKEKEIEMLESRAETADKEKKEAEVTALKTQIAGVEMIRDLLKRRKDMRSADVDAAEAATDYSQAAEETYARELALAKKRQERTAQAGAGGNRVSLAATDQVIREFESSVLESQVDMLKKQEKAASLERDLVEQQIKLAEEQGKFVSK
jgi:hypothetical protein